MLKKVFASVFCVVAMLGLVYSIADAATGTISGTSISQCICFSATGAVVSCSGSYAFKKCSIDVQSILTHLQNTSKAPVAYDVTLFLQEAAAFCVNKAGNSGTANGQPFISDPIALEKANLNLKVDKNGRALSDLIFTDEEILGQLQLDPAVLCPNKNWSAKILVERLQVYGRLFLDDDPTTNACDFTRTDPDTGGIDFTGCTLSDALSQQCSAPSTATVTSPFTYSCSTLCHNVEGNVCPTSTSGDPVPIGP